MRGLTALRGFARHLAGRRRSLAALFALGLLGAAVALATPLVGMAFVDAVATRGDFSAIPWIAAALVALALGDLALSTWSGRVHARLSADVLASLRAELFARCVDAPLEDVERYRQGDLLTRFGTDLPRIQVLLVDGLLGSLSGALFLAVAAAIMLTLSAPLAAWSFAGVAVALVAAAGFRGAIERRTGRVRDAVADLSHFLSERLMALRAVRLHRAAHEDKARLDAASERLSREVVGWETQDALAAGVPGLALAFALAWIYVVGGGLLEAKAISLGTFVAFVLYQGRLFAPAQGLLALVRNLQEARVSVARVVEVLGAGARRGDASAEADAGRAASGAIALEDVAFAYPGRPPVFERVDLRIEEGERVALFGASGAGKSTLVQLLFGLRRPTAGVVRIGDCAADERRCARDAALLGYAGAEPFLLHASVEDNVRYGNPGARREDVVHALRLAAADEFVAALPEGISTVIGGRGLTLSDGQRQRLGLARLVLRDPRILVLDEAFSGLDVATETRVRRNLWAAFADRTMIVVSHRPVELEAFDRILFLHDGRFATVTAEEVRALLAAALAPPRTLRAAAQ